MVNEEILGGLVSALSRGESLEKAMFSFYNAGYGKNDIEEATRELYNQTGGSLGIKPGVTTEVQEQKKIISIQQQKPVPNEPPEQKQETQKYQSYYTPQATQKPVVQVQKHSHEKHKKHRPVQVVSKYGHLVLSSSRKLT